MLYILCAMKYAFELGHQPHISEAEIGIVLSEIYKADFSIIKKIDAFLIIEIQNPPDMAKLMHRLGGTISINEYIGPAKNIPKTIADLLESQSGKINFSIVSKDKKSGLTIKKELKARGKSVRYVEPKNTATIIHNKLVETKSNFTIISNEIFVTVAVQDIEQFTRRDYGRPQTDDKSGMLPPKLARIMINLSGADTDSTLLDAFCGSGTVLVEALDIGYAKVTGSDISKKAVEDSKKNIQWFIQTQTINPAFSIYNNDAATLHNVLKPNSIDVIVSEPYLGKPLTGRESQHHIIEQTTELREIYVRAFNAFAKILKKNGVVVFIIPSFRYKHEWIDVECAEGIKKAGFEIMPFSKESKTLLYHRPEQHLGRRIVRLRKV